MRPVLRSHGGDGLSYGCEGRPGGGRESAHDGRSEYRRTGRNALGGPGSRDQGGVVLGRGNRARAGQCPDRQGQPVGQADVETPRSTGEPLRQLKGFQRVRLDPGGQREMSFAIGVDELCYWDTQRGRWDGAAGRLSATRRAIFSRPAARWELRGLRGLMVRDRRSCNRCAPVRPVCRGWGPLAG